MFQYTHRNKKSLHHSLEFCFLNSEKKNFCWGVCFWFWDFRTKSFLIKILMSREIMEAQYIWRHHSHQPKENQCSSSVVKHIKAPVDIVWSLVRRFDKPQKYKPFVSRCTVQGDMKIGSVREVNVKSGLPATTSTEMLELLDDQQHIIGVKFVGGDHRLKNYSSITTVHPETIDGRPVSLVIESFVVDVPEGNNQDETCYFVNALINCNLKCLADVSERKATQGWFRTVNRLKFP